LSNASIGFLKCRGFIVHKAIGMDTQNFRKNVRRHPDFKEALANHGIVEAQMIGDNRRGFLRPRFVEASSVG
jgi:hypothetical protein